MVNEGYSTYFAEKLWEMIPAVYRLEDAQGKNPGALRAFCSLLAEQAAVLRRSQDRLWDDQFIELCEDWAVPYIGELVGTRLLSALDPRGRRIDVAKTIYYRRRKGTPAVLEELISDITGWGGTVKENFRRLGRCWHRLDPPLAARTDLVSKTPPGGWADLRDIRTAELTGGPFDEFHHTPDMRRHKGGDSVDGRFGIPKLAFFLYRLKAYKVTGAHPCQHQGYKYRIDPSGRDIPLFLSGKRFQSTDTSATQKKDWERWHSARAHELPAPMSCRVLAENKTILLAESVVSPPPSYAIGVEIVPGSLIPIKSTVAANLDSWNVTAPKKQLAIDPERGRLLFIGNAPRPGAVVDYYYGFSGPIGAGTYERYHVEDRIVEKHIKNGGAALSGANALTKKGVTQIDDSATYDSIKDVNGVEALTLQAANDNRPYLRLTDNWELTSSISDACVLLDGLWIGADNQQLPGGAEVILKGDYKEVTIKHVTLDPGGRRTQEPGSDTLPAVALVVEGNVETMVVEACITGPIKTRHNGVVRSLELRDSILQSQDPAKPALEMQKGTVTMERVTVLGKIDVHRLWATEALLTSPADVTDIQTGCFRFGAAIEGSRLPRRYKSLWIDDADYFFTSRRFGDPGFAQISSAAPEELHRGAENGSEIGAFSSLLNPKKLDNLKTKTAEYMPFGLVPIYIDKT